jgi:hypothetical protein
MDGNHRSNRFTKNTDPKDVSLWEKNMYGYFPNGQAYQDYLDRIPVTKEVSCYLLLSIVTSEAGFRNQSVPS